MNTISSVSGSVKMLGAPYQDARIVLYDMVSLQPVTVRCPNKDGEYNFLGLNTSIQLLLVCIPRHTDYNALIYNGITLT